MRTETAHNHVPVGSLRALQAAQFDLRVSDEAFQYLRVQRGSLDHFSKNRGRWEQEYRDALRRSYEGMRPWLPARCRAILDVGSGLGGIDVLLSRHYEEQNPYVVLLDGERDEPVMELHRKTFGHRQVALNFQFANGVQNVSYISPVLGIGNTPVVFDLIVSTGAWCFHFPPDEYLDLVLRHSEPGSVMILDVRREKSDWLARLLEHFEQVGVIADETKRVRRVFRRA